jgi:hypothetical protein
VQFGVTDDIDPCGVRPPERPKQRLTPHLFLAAASQRTNRIRPGALVTTLPLYTQELETFLQGPLPEISLRHLAAALATLRRAPSRPTRQKRNTDFTNGTVPESA